MGIKLMIEVMDHAPKSLSWRELHILTVIAETANDGTRLCWPAYDGDGDRSKRFRSRCRCSRTQFYDVLRKIEEQGALETVVVACKGKQAVYRIPPLAAATPKAGAPVRERRKQPKKGAATGPDCVPLDGTQEDDRGGVSEGYREPLPETSGGDPGVPLCPVQRDPIDVIVSRSAGEWVPLDGTPIPQISSTQKALNAANAAGAGWGVWGEGAFGTPGGEPAASVAVVADAPPGDGLRPRDCVAPDTDASPDRLDEEPQPQLDGDEQKRSDESMAHALADLDEATYVRLKRETKDRLGPDKQCQWVAVMYEFAVGSGLIGRSSSVAAE